MFIHVYIILYHQRINGPFLPEYILVSLCMSVCPHLPDCLSEKPVLNLYLFNMQYFDGCFLKDILPKHTLEASIFCFLISVFGFDTTSYMVVEGADSVVGLTLFRDGSIDLPAAVNITTISGTASGGKLKLQYNTIWKDMMWAP